MLFIDNETVARVLKMKDCIDVQERAFQQVPSGRALQRGRLDFYAPCEREDGYYRWGTMEGVNEGIFAIRMKSDVVVWSHEDSVQSLYFFRYFQPNAFVHLSNGCSL